MIRIGITGEMGSGKSFCSKVFEQMGIPVFYSDDVARSVINTNTKLRVEICKEFGNVYDDEGLMIPHLIRSIVFIKGAEDKLLKLNEIVHPYVFEEYSKFCDIHKDKLYTIAESAILFESGMDKVVDRIIYVSADEETRIDRTFKRSGFSREEYMNRMKSQVSSKKKISDSDYIIYNNDGDDVHTQIKKINFNLISIK